MSLASMPSFDCSAKKQRLRYISVENSTKITSTIITTTKVVQQPSHLSESVNIDESEVEALLGNNLEAAEMDFDKENEADSATALDNIRAIQCPFNKEDIEFWFSQLEDQLTLIGVKKQWTKKIALVRFLPAEVQSEVKSLLTLKQSTAGTDIYFKIKKQLLKI